MFEVSMRYRLALSQTEYSHLWVLNKNINKQVNPLIAINTLHFSLQNTKYNSLFKIIRMKSTVVFQNSLS